jgi:hypothetical protein
MPTPDRYVPGAVTRLSVAITDVADIAVDPGALRLKFKTPAGVTTTYTYGTDVEVVRDSAGAYHADLPLPAAGQYRYRWEADAPYAGASEGFLHVAESLV